MVLVTVGWWANEGLEISEVLVGPSSIFEFWRGVWAGGKGSGFLLCVAGAFLIQHTRATSERPSHTKGFGGLVGWTSLHFTAIAASTATLT